MSTHVAPTVGSRARLGRVPTVLTMGVATLTATTLPLWVAFSGLVRWMDLSGLPTWASIAIGIPSFVLVLSLPAVGWGLVVAAMKGAPPRPVVRTAVRTGLVTAVPVGTGVDLSQLFIDTVWSWHRLAVHAIFTIAFATGIAVFLTVVTRRVLTTLVREGAIRPAGGTGDEPRPWLVTWATAAGVVAASLLAVALDWVVRLGMGQRMLQPLYLVVLGGSAAGGAAFGRILADRTAPGSAPGPEDVPAV